MNKQCWTTVCFAMCMVLSLSAVQIVQGGEVVSKPRPLQNDEAWEVVF